VAFSGPEPKNKKTGHTPPAEWIDVPDEPFDGPERLELPKRRGMKWAPEVVAWWDIVSRMPHCRLWSPSDWLFAVETAFMKQDWWRDFSDGKVQPTKSTEIRRREDVLGTTTEARRKLRIRYVQPGEVQAEQPVPATVASLADRRQRSVAGAS